MPFSADRLLVAITLLHLGLLGVWAVALPLYDAPDEPMHFDMVVDAWEQFAWPGPQEKIYHPGWYGGLEELRYSTGATTATDRALDPVSAAQAPRDWASWTALNEVGFPSDTVRNQMAQHPPLYYRFARSLLALVPDWEDASLAATVMGLRILSVLLAAPLPLLAWRATAVLGGDRSRRAVAALLPAGVPTATHIHSVINNDGLVTLTSGIAIVLILLVLSGDARARVVVGAVAASAAAMLTKAFGLVLAPAAIVAVVVAARRRSLGRLRLWVGGAVAAAPAIWWYVENLVRYRELQPQGFPVVPDPAATIDSAAFATRLTAGLTRSFWGGFGWLEVNVSAPFALALTVVGLLVCALGAISLWRDGRRLAVGVLASPAVLAALLVAYGAWERYRVTGVLRGTQGRYLFVGLVGLAVLASFAGGGLGRRAPAWTWPLVALSAVLALQGHALSLVVHHFWEPGVDGRLAAIRAWHPFAGTVLSIALLAVVVAALLAAAEGLRPRERLGSARDDVRAAPELSEPAGR